MWVSTSESNGAISARPPTLRLADDLKAALQACAAGNKTALRMIVERRHDFVMAQIETISGTK
jgi:hypothetical protein